jgi:hypothetical protein
VAREAVRDLLLLEMTLDQLLEADSVAEFQNLLRQTLGDSVLPQESRANTPGRNSQLHLSVAAVCLRADLRPAKCFAPLSCAG